MGKFILLENLKNLGFETTHIESDFALLDNGEYKLTLEKSGTTTKEFVWELNGYSGSIYAKDYDEARRKINDELSIQEVEE